MTDFAGWASSGEYRVDELDGYYKNGNPKWLAGSREPTKKLAFASYNARKLVFPKSIFRVVEVKTTTKGCKTTIISHFPYKAQGSKTTIIDITNEVQKAKL